MAVPTLSDIATVTWGKTYLWSVRILGNLGVFKNWLPAVSLDSTLFSIDTHSVAIGAAQFSVPRSRGEHKLNIKLYDTHNGDIEKFFARWYSQMFPLLGVVTPVGDIAKVIIVAKMNGRREPTITNSYWCYPTGQCSTSLDNTSAVRTVSVDLVVCGQYGNN